MANQPLSERRQGTARLALSLTAALLVLAAPAPAETDPREPGVRISAFEPSPDGRWVALTCEPGRGSEVAIWLVSLDGGLAEPLAGGFPATPKRLEWSAASQLGIDFASRSAGRHWIDPETREVTSVESGPRLHEQALAGGWARETQRRKVRTLEWEGRDLRLEVSTESGHRTRVTKLPGVVFRSVHERGVVRIFRHDLESGQAEEVYDIESEVPRWSAAPDGSALWVQDDQRQRVVDARTGELIAGPWVEGSLEWLEHDGSRFVRISTGGHVYLVDLLLDRRVHLGQKGAGAPELRVLSDGRFLQLGEDGRLDLHDAEGALVRNLIPGEGVRTAAR